MNEDIRKQKSKRKIVTSKRRCKCDGKSVFPMTHNILHHSERILPSFEKEYELFNEMCTIEEKEIRLFYKPKNFMRYSDFRSILNTSFGSEVPNIQQYMEHCYNVEKYKYCKIRIQWSSQNGTWCNLKQQVSKKLISFETDYGTIIATNSIAIESPIRNLIDVEENIQKICSEVLYRCDHFSSVLCRFKHPLDNNLSITWREEGYSDQGLLIVEYEYQKLKNINLQYLCSFLNLFGIQHWTFSPKLIKSNVFDQKLRPKVYTLHPLREHYIKGTKLLPANICSFNFAKYVIDKVSSSENNYWACKWDGTQHIISFEAEGNVHVLPSNGQLGYYVNIDKSLINETLCKIYWVCEIVQNNLVIVVDAAIPTLSFFERMLLIQTYFNESILTTLTAKLKIKCQLQEWYPFDTDYKVSFENTDGILLYTDNVIYKLKPTATVDLSVDKKGLIHTVSNVLIGKTTNIKLFNQICEFNITINREIYQFELEFLKIRNDRITANSFLEFCESAKASLALNANEKFISIYKCT